MRNFDLRLRKLEQVTETKQEVHLVHWRNFDRNAPCRAGGLESAPNEPYESFIRRVVAAAAATGKRVLWLQNVSLSKMS